VFTGELLAYANPRPAVEGGANAWPGEGVEICENMSLGTVL